MKKIKGNCGDKNFGFYWQEAHRTEDDYFIIGQFQLIVNNQELLETIYNNIHQDNLSATEKISVTTKSGENLTYISNAPIWKNDISEKGYYINLIIRYFKEDLVKIKENKITCSDESKDVLYLKASYLRGYSTYKEDIWQCGDDIENWDWEKIDNNILKYQEKYKSEELPFGFEFDTYPDISNQWHFFLFQNEDKTKDRLIYSNDNGRTVYEVQLELGTVERVLSELPDL